MKTTGVGGIPFEGAPLYAERDVYAKGDGNVPVAYAYF